jgi:hypothetical protein
MPVSATLSGGEPGVKPVFNWTLHGGEITSGRGTASIMVDAKKSAGRTVLAMLEVGGYGPRCSATCLATLPGGTNPVPIPGGLATLSVSVKSSRQDRHVPGATIKFYKADGEPVGQTEMVAQGPYVRGGWTPGEYRVEVIAKNFERQVSNVTLAALSTSSVAFTLQPLGPTTPPPEPVPTAEPMPTAEPVPTATVTPTPSTSPTVTPTPDPFVGPTTPTTTPTPVKSWLSKILFADAEQESNTPWLLLGGVVGLAVAGYLLLLKLLGSGASATPLPDAAAAAAGATQEADEVHCTVYAPAQTAPGASFMVVAFAHLEEHAELLAAEAKERDASVVRRGSEELDETVVRGQELTFQLTMGDLEIDEPSQSFKWKGKLKTIEFFVKVPKTFEQTAVNCKLLVLCESVPIGHVKFKLDVTAAASAAKAVEPEPQAFHRYRNVFISYDSDDRSEVLRRVQMLDMVGINYFQDMLSLKPGERWEKQLYKHIDECDVVFLFWSVSSRESEWVEKEVKYALEHKRSQQDGLPEIMPVIFDGPEEAPPPAYLSEYHFNDKFDYFIKGEDAKRAARAARPEASGQA